MVQHQLLMIVAAPLLILGWPVRGGSATAAARPGATAAIRHALTRPFNAWLLYFAALWLWHLPGLFQAALLHPAWHGLQHGCLLLASFLFWWVVLDERGTARGSAITCLLASWLHTVLLGAWLQLSPSEWYPAYAGAAMEYGWSPREDQRLGAIILWAPACVAYLTALLLRYSGWPAPRHQGNHSPRAR
jgi:putative membrane protein